MLDNLKKLSKNKSKLRTISFEFTPNIRFELKKYKQNTNGIYSDLI